MKNLSITDAEYYALIHELGCNYDAAKGKYIDLPEYGEEAMDSLRNKLRQSIGIEKIEPAKVAKKKNAIMDAIRNVAGGS